VVGATVVGGQFLFVRGLGGRYSNVRLNSVPLPSTDPDLPGFQLDLFPASLLSALTIAKTFTPDIPGDFAGGSMNIATRDFPDHFEVTSSLSLSSDTQTLGRDMQSYDGGGLDFLGFDDGTRALPDEVPSDQVVNRRPPVGDPIDPERAAEIGEAFPNRWSLSSRTAPPSLGLGFSLGDTARLGERRFGYLLTLGYRYGSTRYRETVILPTENTEDGGPAIVANGEPLERTLGKESAQIGLLGTASYELAAGHDLTLVSVLTQTGDDEASLVTSEFSANEGGPIRQTELTFIERQLFFNQLIGAHDLSPLKLDWQINVATVQREQPDTRGLIFVENVASETGFEFSNTSGSGERFYTDLAQTDLGGGADLTLPIDRSRLKSGYLGRLSDRDFSGRRFENNVASAADRRQDAEDIFEPEDSGDVWLLNELTAPEDGYTAEQELHAGYALADVPIASWLRLNGGARVESFHQTITVVPPVASLREDEAESTERTDTDPLPAGSAIVSFSDEMSVRLAYGGTVARPLVRELAPFRVQDFIRRRTVQGDPDLRRTYIHNFDVRWELFPSQTEVFAASVFYKIFLDPIEAVVPEVHSLTYANIESARNYGVELEARVTLDRVSDALKNLVVTANFAWIESEITMTDEQRMQATSARRPLAGQSPYVANLSLGYGVPDTSLSLNLFYNVFGRRILEVGRNGLPDAYEEPFHSLDFTASYQLHDNWTLGASATNLLLQEAVVNQGGLDTSRIDRGMSFGVRLGFAN
jgi:outer membrane receptor protein involved in Fe transport